MGKACCSVFINIYDEFDILEHTVLFMCSTTINDMAMLVSEYITGNQQINGINNTTKCIYWAVDICIYFIKHPYNCAKNAV